MKIDDEDMIKVIEEIHRRDKCVKTLILMVYININIYTMTSQVSMKRKIVIKRMTSYSKVYNSPSFTLFM